MQNSDIIGHQGNERAICCRGDVHAMEGIGSNFKSGPLKCLDRFDGQSEYYSIPSEKVDF